MKRLTVFILGLLVVFMTSCRKVTGEGPIVTQTRNVTGFSGVDLRCSANVYFKQSPNYKVEISAQQNIQDILITEVSNGRLVIRFENDVQVRNHDQIIVVVEGPSGNSFRISGSGNIETSGPITPTSLDLDVSGSGNIDVAEVTTDYIDANISGSGNIRISSGTVNNEKLNISGSGNIDLSNVAANTATTTTSGSGEIRVKVSQKLDVHISGSGSVYYKGNPVVNVHSSGSGHVKQKD